MIDWETLYNKLLCDREFDGNCGELHHVIPIHTGYSDGVVVKLSRRDHILAHYIRYRWLGEVGDYISYKMMSGNLINPMFDEKVKKYHQRIMNSEYIKSKIKNSAIKRWSDVNEREKMSIRRKEYISTLDSKFTVVEHLFEHDIRKKALHNSKEWNLQNSEYLSECRKRGSNNLKINNRNRSKSELIKIYSRPDIQNGRWMGYCYLISNDGNVIKKYNTQQKLADYIGIHIGTLRRYLKSGDIIKRGNFKGYHVKQGDI